MSREGKAYWLSCLSLLLISSIEPASSATYSLVVPQTAVRGRALKAVLYSYKKVPRIEVTVEDTTSKAIYHRVYFRKPHSSTFGITIQVGQDWLQGDYVLSAKASDGSFNGSASFTVIEKSRSILVQTDKAIYKPTQTVNFRVLVTTAELKPLSTQISVTVEDAASHKIRQWTDEPLTLGVASFSLPLSDRPPLGRWKIIVVAGDQSADKTFEVAEYTLPRFAVTVNLPSYITVSQASLHGSVSAVYTYGENVQGTATVRFELYGNRITKTFAINGDQSFDLDGSDLNQLGISNGVYSTLTATANVTEALTGITLSGSSSVAISQYDAQVTFLPATSDYFKKGLTFTAYIKVTHPDGSLLGEKDLRLSLLTSYSTYQYSWKYYYSNIEKVHVIDNRTLTIPDHGIVVVDVVTPINVTESFNLKASLVYKGQTISNTKYINSFRVQGTNNIRVQIVGPTDALKSGDIVTLAVSTLMPSSVYYYTVTARGQTVSYGAAYSSAFSIFLTPQHAPQATFLVYVVGADNEIVADSVTVNVEGAFQNKVSLSFKDSQGRNISQAKPADNVVLQVRSDPASLVGLLSVDQSVLLLGGDNDITQQQLLLELTSYTQSSRYQKPAFLDFFWRWPRWGGSSSHAIFTSAGLTIDTDAFIQKDYYILYERVPGAVGPPGLQGVPGVAGQAGVEGPVPDAAPVLVNPGGGEVRARNFFPETWIWSLLSLNSSGIGSIVQKAPDTITSWVTTAFSMNARSGLAVTPTASKFKVFQNFFVSAILPYSVVRGEEVALKVVVFNYMDTDQTVTVTLLSSPSFSARLEGQSNNQQGNISTSVSVPAGSGRNVQFWIVPGVLGNIKIALAALSPYGGDRVENDLLVKPEGAQLSYCLSDFVILQTRGGYNHTFNLQYPASVVPGSRRVEVRVSGDIMGPSIGGLDQLVQVPYGCGEQNMITFAPNIFVREYLEAIGQLDPLLQTKTQKNMLLGYQGELSYWRKDGLFSAFGDSDDAGSTWLTAFVLKSFRQAQQYLTSSIDDNVLQIAKNKILQDRRLVNGSFIEKGRVIHVDMQGGSSSGLALSAYVLIALLEGNPAAAAVLNSTATTVSLLEASLPTLGRDVYTIAIVTYALHLANSSNAYRALDLLEQLAVARGDTIYWTKDATAALSSALPCHYCPRPSGASAIEMTSYALLTYVRRGDLAKASQVAKWLANQRNSLGGYTSTQDTVLALQSLAAYSRLVRPANFSLVITLNGDNADTFPSIIIKSDNSLLQQSVVAQHPDTLSRLSFSAVGQGSAIVSACVTFNVINVSVTPLVDLRIRIVLPSLAHPHVQVEVCVKSTIFGGSTGGMGITQVNLASGFSVSDGDIEGADIRRIEYGGSSVVVYYDQFNSSWTCVRIRMQQSFPVNSVKDSYIKAYHYYNPDQHMTVSYNPVTGLAESS